MAKRKTALIGVAGVHFVVAELSRRSIIALPTTRNTEGIDIIATNPASKKTVKIQVKTTTRPNWILGKKAEELKEENLFYVFVYIPEQGAPSYYIVPSNTVADYVKETHKKWSETPGQGGKPHNKKSTVRIFPYKYKDFNLGEHRNAWEKLRL